MEQVFVVRRGDFFAGAWPEGFFAADRTHPRGQAEAWRQAGFFAPRDEAEEDPSLKQIIPYCLVTRGAEIFLTRRRKQGGEGRLHGLYSVGLGGHVGPEDGGATDPDLFEKALRRELHEELHLPPYPDEAVQVVGWCNDETNAVGAVHAGLVYRLDLSASPSHQGDDKVQIREIHKLAGGFGPLVEIDEVWEDPHRFETWSQLVLEALYNLPRQGEVLTPTRSDQGNVREEYHRRRAGPGSES